MSKAPHDDEPAEGDPLSGPRCRRSPQLQRLQPDRSSPSHEPRIDPSRDPSRRHRASLCRPLWRTLLSALAGGGLTAAGLAGPLATAAGAETASNSSTTTDSTTPPATTTTESAPETTSTTPTTTTPSPEPTTTTPSTTTSGTTTSTATTPATTTPASAPEATSPAPAQTPKHAGTHGSGEGPIVLVRRKQRPSTANKQPASSTHTKTKSGAKKAKGKAETGGPNNVALPPQLVAGEARALAAELDGAAASAQALDFYRIPLFLLPIYQAAAAQYGVPWQILAAINEIETDYGTDLSISSAGAEGWMQFMPSTWLEWGVDALNAGYADPYNPVDAIFAAARYLSAAGASSNLDTAIFAYNHSEAYVSSVLLRAKLIASYPDQVISTLTGLVDADLPVNGRLIGWEPPPASTALPSSSSATAGATPTGSGSQAASGAASEGGSSSPGAGTTPGSSPAPPPASAASAAGTPANAPQLATLMSEPNADAVAVQDGVVVKVGHSRKLGNYVQLRDVYGDVFTYAGLQSIARSYSISPAQAAEDAVQPSGSSASAHPSSSSATVTGKVRAFAHPGNPDARVARAKASRKRRATGRVRPLRNGAIVTQGTVLGRVSTPVGATEGSIRFAIQPVGDTGTIDPSAILANWSQLHSALHPRGVKGNPSLVGATASDALLLSKPRLEREVLSDPGIAMPECARHEVAAGKIDKRALAVLAYLSRSGLKPTVGTLPCGNGAYTANGYVFPGHSGDAIAILAINGTPIAGHQGAGSITDTTIRTLLTLPGEYFPARIVSLMRYPGAPSTVARPDHGSYIEVVFALKAKRAAAGRKAAHAARTGASASVPAAVGGGLSATQWEQLISRAGALTAPHVVTKPTSGAILDPKSARQRP
jgi:Transglycosylase SLT domain